MHEREPQTRHGTTALTTRATPSHKEKENIRHNVTSPRERELTSCGYQVPVWNEEFIPIMLLQHVGEDLQGKALFLPGFLAPLVGVHFGVGQVSVVVLVICRHTRGETGQGWVSCGSRGPKKLEGPRHEAGARARAGENVKRRSRANRLKVGGLFPWSRPSPRARGR